MIVRPRLLLLVVLVLAASDNRARAGESSVRVSIWEGLPTPWTWQALDASPSDQYTTPALGITRLPAKYNARGILCDRSAPYLLRAEATVRVPAGPYRLILRSRGAARIEIDGTMRAESKAIEANSAGHEDVPALVVPEDPRWRYVATGDQERIVPWTSDGAEHRVTLSAVIGAKKLRPETGELAAWIVAPGGVPVLLGGAENVPMTDAGWTAYAGSERVRLDDLDAARRRLSARSEDDYWQRRHDLARRAAETRWPAAAHARNPLNAVEPGARADDAAFFRRLALDTIGVIPDAAEVAAFLADTHPDKRARAIDARLADPRWADGWMGYWQDVLAENPGILKPTLNNTGPFRVYLHTAFLDNTPADRFATELIRMEGSTQFGGPAGFAVASQNDAPLAAKAHIVAKAFLAAELKCARCHDAPSHPYDQGDLFSLAAMLAGKPVTIPVASTIKSQEGGRTPAVSVSLKAGDRVPPRWSLTEIAPDPLPDGLLLPGADARERLAALVTGPGNRRFAPVLVNRLWARYLGRGLVEPIDDWDDSPSTRNPEVLDFLAFELMTHDFDLKHVARLILNAPVYQAKVAPGPGSEEPTLAPIRRRLSAEQLLDSLFAAVGKPFGAEELNLDPDGRRPPTEFLNLGTPRHAWEFTSTSNERDRPALSLPVVQHLADVLQTFGWRPSRQDPITIRDEATTPLQPALLANGVAVGRAVRLSDDAPITALCRLDQPAEALIRSVYLRVLSRLPNPRETERLVAFLGDSYATRIVAGAQPNPPRPPSRRVSWSNHLHPDATTIQLEHERAARAGDPPTVYLTADFRERMEDLVWALLNSPEFLFLP